MTAPAPKKPAASSQTQAMAVSMARLEVHMSTVVDEISRLRSSVDKASAEAKADMAAKEVALTKRMDDMKTEADKVHTDLVQRVGKLERFQYKLAGVLGFLAVAGGGSGWVAMFLQAQGK